MTPRGQAMHNGPTGGNSGPSFSQGPLSLPPDAPAGVTFWDLI